MALPTANLCSSLPTRIGTHVTIPMVAAHTTTAVDSSTIAATTNAISMVVATSVATITAMAAAIVIATATIATTATTAATTTVTPITVIATATIAASVIVTIATTIASVQDFEHEQCPPSVAEGYQRYDRQHKGRAVCCSMDIPCF